jgi:hypothetical protein
MELQHEFWLSKNESWNHQIMGMNRRLLAASQVMNSTTHLEKD